ncbi:MAG: thrombospondin type 3 repeat-containing protein [Thermoplasmatota archaeon]
MPLTKQKKQAFAAGAGFAIVVMFAGVAIWLMLDVDQDGRSGYQEMGDGTNPINGDSDGDGASDGWEIEKGGDPTQASPKDEVKREGCDLGILNCQQTAPQASGGQSAAPAGSAPPSGGDGTTATFIAGGALSLVAGVGARITSSMILKK